MSTVPQFFLPHCEPDEQEEIYERLATDCHRTVPSQRIFSISYRHDADHWTATVGAQLQGSRTEWKGSRRKGTERTITLHDPATVLAIFPGVPYMVYTDGGRGRTRWENPFLAGDPISVTYFTT